MQITQQHRNDYKPICNFVCDTYARMDDNQSLSPELRKVMREFNDKSLELREALAKDSSTHSSNRVSDLVVEVEQAADSAMRAIEAAEEPTESLVAQIKEAHDRVKGFKDSLLQ